MPQRLAYSPFVVACSLIAVVSFGCSDDTPGPAAVPPSSAAPGDEQRVVVAAGPHQFHVEPHASGHVYAYAGATVLEPTDATLTIDVPVEGGTRSLTMRWDARDRRYEGRVTGVTILPGALTIHLSIGGLVFVGTNVIVVVLPAVVVVHEDHDRHHHKHKHRGRH